MEVVDGTMDDDCVLENVVGVGGAGIRVIPRYDRASNIISSPRDGEIVCGRDASRGDTEEELSAHRRSNLRCGVGVADALDEDAEIEKFAGRAGLLVIFGDCWRPGTLTGKHFDGKGLEEDHNGVDQGALCDPIVASMPRSISRLTSLSTLIPVFEAPALSPQTPCSSIPTLSAQCMDTG